MPEEEVGEVFNFFAKPSVAAIKVSDTIRNGDTLHFKGSTTDFTLEIKSMEIEGRKTDVVEKGAEVGIRVPRRVRPGDKVFLVKG